MLQLCERTNVLLFEFTSQVALQSNMNQRAISTDLYTDEWSYLDKSGLAGTTVTDYDQLGTHRERNKLLCATQVVKRACRADRKHR